MTNQQHDRRLIEDSLPLEAISYQSAREKSIRHGHISTLHIWWARRPLAAMRAAIFAALMPAPKNDEEREQVNTLLSESLAWEVSRGDDHSSQISAELTDRIQKSSKNENLKILDAFMGGGSVGLEALRLGVQVDAVDNNPVAYLIGKATLEFPQKYGKRLVTDLQAWSESIQSDIEAQIDKLFPSQDTRYIWTYTIQCSNQDCCATVWIQNP
jgi:putative DNA methylase